MSEGSTEGDPSKNAWGMNELQLSYERVVEEANHEGKPFTTRQKARLAELVTKRAGRELHQELSNTAQSMLSNRRAERHDFEQRNCKRWRKAFDLIDTIWVACEEVGREFNHYHRPTASMEQDYTFESLVHLHAKSLLVTSEIICLLKGGFADGALARWRTLYETNVIAAAIAKNGQGLALRYLAHSRVQSWKIAQNEGAENYDDEEVNRLKKEAERALERFGTELNRRNGWACGITNQKHPTFDKIAAYADRTDGLSMYQHASHHIHSNHRSLDALLGTSESKRDVLLVGPSNSGMIGPLTLTAIGMVEATTLLLSSKPNLDRIAVANALLRMANGMKSLSSGIERRTYRASLKTTGD